MNRSEQKSRILLQIRICLLILLACTSHEIQAASGLFAVGSGGGQYHFINLATVRQDGKLVRYQLLGRGISPGGVTYSAEVGADCVHRTRIEFLMTSVRADGQVATTTASSPDMFTVYKGTRQELELDVACRVANGENIPPNVQPEITPQPPAPVPTQIPQPNPQMVARPKSSGTGFVVSPDGTIVTNHHVVSDCSSIRVLMNKTLHDAHLFASDKPNDLAVIRISAEGLPALSLAKNQIEVGASVTVLGYPLTSVLGTELKATTGIVSSLSGVRGERQNMQISASVQPGNSGGPVLDDRGAVVGVVVAKLASRFTAENVNFAVRMPLLRSFLEINGVDITTAKPGPAMSVAEIVKKAAPSTLLLFCY